MIRRILICLCILCIKNELFFDARHFFYISILFYREHFTFLSKITFRKHLFSFIQQYLFIIISCTIMSQKKFAYTRISGYSCSLSGRTVIIEFSPVLILRSIGALMGQDFRRLRTESMMHFHTSII